MQFLEKDEGMMPEAAEARVSVVIPTFGRERVLIETIGHLLSLAEPADEIIVVDQTPQHEKDTEVALGLFQREQGVRVIRLRKPSITHAMNVGLQQATGDIVIFVDDDIQPLEGLIRAHRAAYAKPDVRLVAGRVLQPWHQDGSRALDGLASESEGVVDEFIGCNFSVDRRWALRLGGFDERFVKVAYRYEAEFAARARRAGVPVQFVPLAALLHLRAERGGTRSYGDHLRAIGPAHSVGGYYFLLRAKPAGWLWQLLSGPARAVATRYHLNRPWFIPVMLVSHLFGLAWAIALWVGGPKLIVAESGRESVSKTVV